MDATAVFDNESIWVFEQLYETLYTVTPDGKSVKPWLATSYDLSPDKLTYTFHLRNGVQVPHRQGDDGRRRQVLARRRAQPPRTAGATSTPRSRA